MSSSLFEINENIVMKGKAFSFVDKILCRIQFDIFIINMKKESVRISLTITLKSV